MTIPQIPLDTFLKIWAPSIIFSVIGFGVGLISKIKEYKEEIKKGVTADLQTGVPHLHEKDVQRLLNFDDKKHLIGLGIATLCSFIFGIIYMVSSSIEPFLNSPNLYKSSVSICSWIALLSVLITVGFATRLYIYVIQLWSKTTEK